MDRGAALLCEWWIGLLSLDPPTADVVGLWFGIIELVTEEGVSWSLYVNGCEEFDPDDEDAEWAGGQSWQPSGRYIAIPGFEHYAGRPFGEMLEHVARLIRSFSPQDYWSGRIRGVAVGYDDGDFVITYKSGNY